MKSFNKILSYLYASRNIVFSSQFNLGLNIAEARLGRNKLLSHPVILDIVPTKVCNLNCIFCVQYDSGDARYLSLDDFQKIAEKLFPYAFFVNFCSGGEPFLNKNFMEFLSICKRYKILINIVSNGTLLSEPICRELIENGRIRRFSFSFDGIKRETVESIRRGINYQKVIDNMCLMAGLKSKNKQRSPLLEIRYAAMRRNIEELPELLKYASRIGINQVNVNYLNVSNDIDKKESLFYHKELTGKIFGESAVRAKELGIRLILPPLAEAPSRIKKCDMPWKFIKIDPDGSVRFCYKACDNPIGNIFDSNDFLSLWNNKHYRLIRKTVNSDKPYFKFCSVCSVRRGFKEEDSHIQYQREDLYEFDKAYEKLYNITTPSRLRSKPINERKYTP